MPDIFVANPKPKQEIARIEKKPDAPQGVVHKAHRKDFKGKKVSPWAAFARHPVNLRFETQDQEEKIILFLRRHFVTNIPWILIAAFMGVLPIVSSFLPIAFVPFNFRLVAIISWYLITFAFAFERFLSWFFNVHIVTDERIVDIDFPNLLYRDISTTKIDQIQDISVKVGGFIRSVFDYGDVNIQTAGEVPEISFEGVPHPALVSKTLTDLIIEEEQEKIEGRVR